MADGSDVERQVLFHLGDHHAADAGDLDARRGLEGQRDPVTELAARQLDLFPVDIDRCLLGRPIQIDGHGNRQRRIALQEHVLRAFDLGLVVIPGTLERHPHPTFLELALGRPCREEEKGALRAQQIRHAHGAQLGSIELVRRKGDGHAQHGAPDAVLTEDGPEGLGLPQQPELGLLEGDPVLPQLQEPIDATDMRRGQERQIGPQVPIQEVEDVVLGWGGSGAERGPGDRRDGRKGRPQLRVGAPLGQALEVGQLALLHEAIGQPRILTVETDDDKALDLRLGPVLLTQQPPQHPEWPGQDGNDGQQNRREDDQKRGQQGETGAWTDVGCRRRHQHQSEPDHQPDCPRLSTS